MKNIFKKVGMTLASVLILASMFTGVALAKPAAQEFKTLNICNTAAAVMSKASDPVQAFFTLSQNTQDVVQSQLQFYFKQMEAIVNNGGDEYQLQTYIKTIPEAIAYIIQVDFTHTITISDTDDEFDNLYARANSEDNLILEDEDDQSGATTRGDIYFYKLHNVKLAGTISGDTHWYLNASIWGYYNEDSLVQNTLSKSAFSQVYNGWKMKSNTSKGRWDLQTLDGNYMENAVYMNAVTAEFSNGWFTTEYGEVGVGIVVAGTKPIYTSYDDAYAYVNWGVVLSAIAMIISAIKQDYMSMYLGYTALYYSLYYGTYDW